MTADNDNFTDVPSRAVSECAVPLVTVQGSAYECGKQYYQIVKEKYPHYRRYLSEAHIWKSLSGGVKKIFEKHAPYIIDIFRGLTEDDDCSQERDIATDEQASCTSFSVSSDITVDGYPISGQTKDTTSDSIPLYIVLRMRIADGPTILVLAYPGEILGYGFWTTGMSLFRNNLHSSADSEGELTMSQWGLLALAGNTIDQAIEFANAFGIAGSGNCLITDSSGKSVSVEFNKGGVDFIFARNGINTHANHPVGEKTSAFENYPDDIERANSRFRMSRLYELLDKERGRLTAPKAMSFLADHRNYPRGICRHIIGQNTNEFTTAAIVAEPAKGKLHVIKGKPCSNWPVTYTV